MVGTLLAIIAAYLVGSIPFGLVIGKLWTGIDVREFGSGNIGTSNVLRTMGPAVALVVFALDVAKGFFGVYLGSLAGGDIAKLLAGTAAIAGHNWPIYLNFRGGKGIATSLGVLLGLTPVIALVLLGVWILIVGLTRYISLASLAVAVLFPFLLILFKTSLAYIIGGIVLSAFAIYRHTSNIERLLSGREYKIGEKGRRR